MKAIFEPDDEQPMYEDKGVTPNLELLEGKLRLHFHQNGVTFGLIDPQDPRFAALLPYAAVRQMMLEAAHEQRREKKLFSIVVNGTKKEVSGHGWDHRITYEELVALAGEPVGASMTWRRGTRNPFQGMLAPGESVELSEGMIVEAIVTGNA